MKKTLVALAALAATSAFAQVTITGAFDPSVVIANTTYGDDSSASQNFVRNSSQGTSNITFQGAEDLGGGLKALFLYEADFNAANQASSTNALGSGGGQIYTGISGSFGAVKLGAPNTPSLDVQSGRSPFGAKIGSGFGGVLGKSHVREDNSVNYTSPVVFGGLTAAVNYSFAVNADPKTTPATTAANAKSDVGFTYASGPLFAGLSFYNQDGVNRQTNLAVNYDFGMAKLFVGAHTEVVSAAGVDSQSNGLNLAVSVPFGQLSLMANYGQLDDKSAANVDKTIFGLGAKYHLSKRTSVYARFVNEKNDNVGANAVKAVTSTLAGIQHNF